MFKLQKCGIYLAPKILAYYQRKKKFTNASHEKKIYYWPGRTAKMWCAALNTHKCTPCTFIEFNSVCS